MKITIHSPEADYWFNKICEALVGIDVRAADHEDRFRKQAIRKINRILRLIPFVKPWPDDKKINLSNHYGMFSKYEWDAGTYRMHEEDVGKMFHALSDLVNERVHAVDLTDDEINLIRRYANASTNS